jgi:hypothetical protein
MVAIAACRVRFRAIIHEDGTVECWKKPRLGDWEVPCRDPREARPSHPEVRAARRAHDGDGLRASESESESVAASSEAAEGQYVAR